MLAVTTASLAAADDGASAAVPDDGLKLRGDRRFNVLGKKGQAAPVPVGVPYPASLRKSDAYPLFIRADRMEGRSEEVSEASGDVELRKAGTQVYGDRMTYWPLDDEIEATSGNRVRLLQEGQEFTTPHLRLKLSEQVGFAESADYLMVRDVASKVYGLTAVPATASTSNVAIAASSAMVTNIPASYGLPTTNPPSRPSLASGTAERAEFEGENQILLSGATFSTCKPGQTDWYLSASRMHLDYDRGVGNASNAALWFKDVPIFYTPAATFPLNSQRQSGFLSPLAAASTRTGFDLTVPYYWNIAPNYDVTFFPRYMSKRGGQIGIEARYLDYNVPAPGGSYKAEYMPHDQQTDSARWGYSVVHAQNLGRGFAANVNWNAVSDDFYWQDMSSRLSQTSQVQLPQNVTLNYAPLPGLQSNLIFQRFQTLQTDPASPVLPPYFMEPQMNVLGFKSDVLGMDFGLLGQYTRFTVTPQSRLINAIRPEGDRAFIYPQLSLPFVHPAYTLIPKIGVQATQYAITPPVGESYNLTRTLPVFSVDSSLNFERDTELLGKGFIQTLEPRLYYVNIPYRNQDAYPVFDTYINDFNFTQVFTENRYSGFDRLNDANQMTAAVSTRMLDAETGVERFKALVGQRYYFTAPRVLLPGEAPIPQGWSNLLMAFNGLVMPKTYAQANWEYNYRDAVNERLSVGMRYQPEMTKALSASYRFARNPLDQKTAQTDQFDIAGQWPLTSRLYLVGRYNFSLKDSQLLEAIAGFEYNAGCWAFRAVGQRLEAISGEPNNAIFLQLELSDFASIGNNPISLLRRSIPGYGKSNELPTSSALLMPQ